MVSLRGGGERVRHCVTIGHKADNNSMGKRKGVKNGQICVTSFMNGSKASYEKSKWLADIILKSLILDLVSMLYLKQDRFTTCFKDLWNEFLGFIQKV